MTLSILLLTLFACDPSGATDDTGRLASDDTGTVGDDGIAFEDPDDDVCTVQLPANVHVVTDTYTSSDAHEAVWVCSGANATLSGAGVGVYVESGGSATIDGADAIVLAARSATVTVNGTDSVVGSESGSETTLGNSSVTEIDCTPLDVDTTLVAEGCE